MRITRINDNPKSLIFYSHHSHSNSYIRVITFMNTTQQKNKRQIKGVVVGTGMNKTVVVEVSWFTMHPKYKKYVKSSKRVKAHDEKNECKIGDAVLIEETRPISKDKHFKIVGSH